MKNVKTIMILILCLVFATSMLTGCGSEAKKAMDTAVESATTLLENGDKPFDPATKDNLEKAIASADEAKDDDAYNAVTEEIEAATKAYEDSIKQLKQVTNPDESFLIERAKTVDTITDVEAATEETDINKLMNKPGEYTSYIAMKSSMVEDDYYDSMGPVEAGNDGGAVIEAFATVKDAENREQYLAGYDGQAMLSPGTHTVVGTLLVRTSSELTASQQKQLEKDIIEALIKLED